MVGQRDDQILCFFYLALIQVAFYDGDRFWTREAVTVVKKIKKQPNPKKLKNNFSPKEVLFFKGSYTLLH